MMYWDSGWAWLWMATMMVASWGVVVFAAIAIVRRPGRSAAGLADARDILDTRFARGEIDGEEYKQRRRILDGDTQVVGPRQ